MHFFKFTFIDVWHINQGATAFIETQRSQLFFRNVEIQFHQLFIKTKGEGKEAKKNPTWWGSLIREGMPST